MIKTTFRIIPVLALAILSSCAPSRSVIERVENTDMSHLNGMRICVRGRHLLVESRGSAQPISCFYYPETGRYRFSAKVDSLLRQDHEDSMATMQTLDAGVKAFMQLGVRYARGSKNYLEMENGNYTFVRFGPDTDSLRIADFFGDRRYKQSGSVYYYRQH